MKNFNLEDYNAGKEVVTAAGAPVRILCTDLKNIDYQVVAAILDEKTNTERVKTFNIDGYNMDCNVPTRIDLKIKD